MGRGLWKWSRVLDSTGLWVSAAECCSAQKKSPGEAGLSQTGKSQVVPPDVTDSATTFSKWFLLKSWAHLHQKQAGSLSLKYFLPSREQTSKGFELQSSLVRTQVLTTRSQKTATANCSPATQSSALQVPEQQDEVRRCGYLNRHWWTSHLLHNAFLKLGPNHSSLELGFFNIAV